MSSPTRVAPVTAAAVKSRKSRGEKVTMLTAYDAPSARLLESAGVDVILVGDSVGNVVLGYESTIPVSMEEMLHHTRAVVRGARNTLVVGDMPYLSYQTSVEDAVRNAGRFVKEAGAQAVKLEGGRKRLPAVRAILDAEIPVMGHVGLTPQSVHRIGGYRVQGTTEEAAEEVFQDALALDRAGVFAIVLECVPMELAARITKSVEAPTIGIGAGPHCDGQVLVFHDFLGITEAPYRFVRRYADLGKAITDAAARFVADVQAGRFPSESESFHTPAGQTRQGATR